MEIVAASSVYKWFFLLLLTLFFSDRACSQIRFPNGKKCAIVLTYDDGLSSQVNKVIPLLNDAGLKGTFFLTGGTPENLLDAWRNAAAKGHELANHTLFHPCSEKDYKATHYSESYTVGTIVEEVAVMNKLLYALDGQRTRTMAYPCSECLVGGDKDYSDSLGRSKLVLAARVGGDQQAVVSRLAGFDRMHVPSWGVVNNPTGAQLIEFVKLAEQKHGFGIYMFHGIGGDYLTVSVDAHKELVSYLKAHKDTVWVPTFRELMNYLMPNQR